MKNNSINESTLILSGIPLRDKIKADLKTLVSSISFGEVPKLAIVQVGDLYESSVYIKMKKKFGADIGVEVDLHSMPEDITEENLVKLVHQLNKDPKVGGIIIQLPLPKHIRKDIVIDNIDVDKDVDGLHSVNVKKLMVRDFTGMIPATALGVLSLLNFYSIDISGKRVVIVGRSSLVGMPTSLLLLNADATVTIAHHKTNDLKGLCKEADILVVAVGVPNLITKEYVKKGQVVIDVGISRTETGIVGDVAFEEVLTEGVSVSPVPGGVGPLTVAFLFQNLLKKYASVSNDY